MDNSHKKKKKAPPQLNKFMHPRNPYRNHPSFKELAIAYPEFRTHCTYDCTGKVFLDFQNTDALKSLTTCLLEKDFGLKVHIPDNRLVPTLPLRLNYLLWIEDLLSLGYPSSSTRKTQPVIGFDIGTGAACIYPLLGSKKFGWSFIATETDDLSFQSAQTNVEKNELKNLILLSKSSELFDILKEEDVKEFIRMIKHSSEVRKDEESQSQDQLNNLQCNENNVPEYLIDFTMCNPPFFSSELEMDTNQNNKKETRSQPCSVSTGAAHEKITDGGEITFVTRIIESSLQYKNKIKIFSTLVGKKSDVKLVVRLIKEKSNGNYVCISDTEFCQGRTMRWGVAWTYDQRVNLNKVLSKKKKFSQKPLTLPIPRSLMNSYTVAAVWSKLTSWLQDIKLKPVMFKKTKYFIGATLKAYKTTWLNQRKKRRQMNKQLVDAPRCPRDNSEETNSTPKENTVEEMVLNTGGDFEVINSSQKRKNECETVNQKKLKSFPTDNVSFLDQGECLITEENLQEKNGSNYGEDDPNQTILSEESDHLDETAQASDLLNEKITDDSATGPLPHSSSTVDRSDIKTGLDCILKCSVHLKQTDALISLEMNFVGGNGKKEAMHQLFQYLENKLKT